MTIDSLPATKVNCAATDNLGDDYVYVTLEGVLAEDLLECMEPRLAGELLALLLNDREESQKK